MKMNQLLEPALTYHKHGFSVIPIKPRDKTALIKWEPYQSNRAAEGDIRAWCAKWPDGNLAIVTGAISGLVVIDLDSQEAKDKLKELLADYNRALFPEAEQAAAGNCFLSIQAYPFRPDRAFFLVWTCAATADMWWSPRASIQTGSSIDGKSRSMARCRSFRPNST